MGDTLGARGVRFQVEPRFRRLVDGLAFEQVCTGCLDVPAGLAEVPLVIADLEAILLNTDGIRSYTARRTMVDILKVQQALASYAALRRAQDALIARRPSLSGDDRLQTEELLARVSAAVSPYHR